MARILVLVLAVGILFYVGSKLVSIFKNNVIINKCSSCNGLGYWVGTRGEHNSCKDCGGSGKG